MNHVTRTETRRKDSAWDSWSGVWIDIVESFEKDGHRYERSGYTINGHVSEDIKQHHFFSRDPQIVDRDTPDVLCGDCQGDKFTITFGDYSVHARCTNCGKDEEIYSG